MRKISLTALLTCVAATISAQSSSEQRVYIFGNSLVHHLSDSAQTSVPYWLNRLADAGGNGFSIDGQWGLLRNFANDLPPVPNWTVKGAPSAWNPDSDSFTDSDINTIILTPANFIQYQPADAIYDGDNPKRETPLKASLAVLDWAFARKNGARYFIYEGWADMGSRIKAFPPSKAELHSYLNHNGGAYHDWYTSYLQQIKASRPDLNIELIPVAKGLAELLTQMPLAELPATRLFTDDAPHGTATLYFLASLITYKTLYDTLPPIDFQVPDTVDPIVRQNYAAIIASLDTGTEQAAMDKETPKAPPNVPAAFAQPDNPPLAMGLDGIADWSAQQPFVNIMKSARPWVGHIKGQWGGWDADELGAKGYLDADGWPTKIPDDLSHIESFILTNQPPEAASTAGRYRLTYLGEGQISVGGMARRVRAKPGEIWFSYAPGEDTVGISIKSTDPAGTGNYIRDIAVVKEENIPLFEVGDVFNPHWITRIRDLRSVRFMDWMFTNGSKIEHWEQRPKQGDYTYVSKGAPVEVMVSLANEIGADPWFNMPHKADEDYNRNFASYVRDELDPNLKAYVEYSNEVWNYTFPQAQWALQQAEKRWGRSGKQDGWMQYAGMRAAQTGRIWREVYGAAAKDRLVRVVATHTDWPGLEKALLQAPLWQADGGQAPVQEFDAYAVTGYFGLDIGGDELAPTVLEWIEQSRKLAESSAAEKGLSGPALRRYVTDHQYDQASILAAQTIVDGSLSHLLNEALPYQATVAKDNGLQLVMYEGGTHVVGLGEWAGNEDLGAFFSHFNYTPEMAEIYRLLLTGWQENNGTLFNAFVDVARTSKWGSWGALRHLDDTNPRWDVLMDFNRNTPAWWSARPAETFAHGVTRWGTDQGETLTGTPHEDTLLGGDGDDLLVSLGGSDRLHGGAGVDQAVLPGKFADIQVEDDGAVTLIIGPHGVTRLFAIETVTFADEPNVIYTLAD